ncbi:MAG: AtpZ/AtpI family protein [Elusimicrobia bacterium]|nr:AtpZ/AtpI family protein [Elusimicrobiota bacterium]MDE2314432.1 AtpZ/AtpI family protein [Elusimicrobiota bacterium]
MDQQPDGEQGRRPEDAGFWAVALSAGTDIVVSVLGGFLLGYWLDDKFSTGPWLAILGSFIGVAIGLYELIRMAKGGALGGKKRG